MGLVERLNELESMRQSGQISDSEYAMLVASATKRFSDESVSTDLVSDKSTLDVRPNSAQVNSTPINKTVVGAGLALILVLGFYIFGRAGSKEEPSEAQIQVSETTNNEMDSRLNSAKACRSQIGFEQYRGVLSLIRNRFANREDSLAAANHGLVVVDYQRAGSLTDAKSWISKEMYWLKLSLGVIMEIDRPELSIEKTAMIRLINELVGLQEDLLNSISFLEFDEVVGRYHVVLERFFNSHELPDALNEICKS